jgi:hypothetical protein
MKAQVVRGWSGEMSGSTLFRACTEIQNQKPTARSSASNRQVEDAQRLTMWNAARVVCQRTVSAPKQVRYASILSKLAPMPGSQVNSTRLGRGPGNKKGKTAGRGTKGQNARAGGPNSYYEGGQTPIHIRFPKIGHNSS